MDNWLYRQSAYFGKDAYIELSFCSVTFVSHETKYRLLYFEKKKVAMRAGARPSLLPLVVIFVVWESYPSTIFHVRDPAYFLWPQCLPVTGMEMWQVWSSLRNLLMLGHWVQATLIRSFTETYCCSYKGGDYKDIRNYYGPHFQLETSGLLTAQIHYLAINILFP